VFCVNVSHPFCGTFYQKHFTKRFAKQRNMEHFMKHLQNREAAVDVALPGKGFLMNWLISVSRSSKTCKRGGCFEKGFVCLEYLFSVKQAKQNV
jgi:hypothetical protein